MSTPLQFLAGLRNPPFLPSSIPNLLGWWQPSGLTPATNNTVLTSWTDSSGNGHNFSGDTFAKTETNVLNGYSSCRQFGTGAGPSVSIAGTPFQTTYAFFFVIQYTTAGQATFLDLNPESLYYDFFSSTIRVDPAGTDGALTVSENVWYDIILSVNSGNLTAYVNGTADSSYGNIGGLAAGISSIALNQTPSFGRCLSGDHVEVAVWSQAVSSSQAASLHSYAVNKYGV